ncbi:MAG: pantoate--beta-alanine ligase [Polyangiaceae bacterium]
MADGLLTLSSPAELREACDWARKHGPVGFVPTMGALHDGHLALVKEAKKKASFVIASVFVNPTQFGPNEDFSRYPRDIDGDRTKLAAAGCGLLFAPETNDMYPAGDETRVRVGALADVLEGEFRPEHFEGVATVVTKLFSMVGPCTAVFGRKDYQQLQVLRRVTKDLFLPIEIIGYKIVRETDGVAMSSRNAYLSAADRDRARGLSRGLSAAWKSFSGGEKSASVLRNATMSEVLRVADSIDYVAVSDADSLQPISENVGPRALVSIACRIGKTRLIDNVVLGEDPDPLAV